jgi:hypothetical protein
MSALGLDVPAGTEIQIRLKTKISSQNARAKDPVEAVVIAPAMVNGKFVIPTGAAVRGTVEKVTPSTKPDERAVLLLAFTELENSGVKSRLAAQVVAADRSTASWHRTLSPARSMPGSARLPKSMRASPASWAR